MDINRSAPAVASVETFIDAPPPVVWAVLADLRTWPEWNPDVGSLDLDGPLAPGSEFRWTSGGVRIRSTIREVAQEQRIGWTGQAPLGIQAVHTWSFEPEAGGTRVRTEESFEGLLTRLFSGSMQKMLGAALEKNMGALKAEAERRKSKGTA